MAASDCLDCALFECDVCARVLGEEYGCCCGRVGPEWHPSDLADIPDSLADEH